VPERFADAASVMRRALELAARGTGAVEPNPPVGAVVVDDQLNLIAEGFHQRYGGPHAEIEAINRAADRAADATMFVTLEPCCHQGKTGPCTEAIRRAGIRKVVVALRDPYSEVDGKGIEWLRSQGIAVDVGLLAEEGGRLIAPFEKRVTTGRPWVHAKWAISLDGKIATGTGDSRWISSDASRAVVHRLRGRMDAILVGAETALRDDPLLTARPAGPRVATRIVVDSAARLPLTSQLVRTSREAPLLIATLSTAPLENIHRLEAQGAEVLTVAVQPVDTERPALPGPCVDIDALLAELGRREFSHVLVEGGGRLLGSFFDAKQIDEVHVFMAPKIIGGSDAPSAVAGRGRAKMDLVPQLHDVAVRQIGEDVYVNGRLPKPA